MKRTSMPIGMIFIGCLIAIVCMLAVVPHRSLNASPLINPPLIMPAR